MTDRVRWLHGEAPTDLAVAEALATDSCVVLHESDRRRVVRIGESPGALLVKQFRVGSGPHPWRDRVRSILGFAPGEREYRSLCRLAAAGLDVPQPLALGVLPDADRLVVSAYAEGCTLRDALGSDARSRRKQLAALGGALARLHAAGYVHGDLHHGNILVTARGPLLLDLQQARRTRNDRDRIRDLAHLDHSLAEFLSTADRVRLRAAALGLGLPFDARGRAAIRAVGAAAGERARRHAGSRRRHAAREGRAFAAMGIGAARGLRLRTIPETVIRAALEAHEAALTAEDARVLEHDRRGGVCAVEVAGHRMVSKEVRGRSLGRRLADLVRGAPARRAWASGHALQIRAIGAATPLAFLEWRRVGLPTRSIVWLEDLRPDEGAHRVLETAAPAARAAALDALLRLVLQLHRAGVDHGDLKASNVLLRPMGRRFEPRLIDLEAVRFLERVPDALRMRALAQLNASIGDALSAGDRCTFFARYAQALRFQAGAAATRCAIVRESIDRRHRWTGAGCADARTGGD